MYAIGNITCQAENHGHSISGIMVEIGNTKWFVGNYEEHKGAIDKLVSGDIYGGNTSAVFRYEPEDQFAYYVPIENITEINA